MPQTTVYVPDLLWDRVKHWRDRELMNVSSICQRALQSEVRRLELTQEERHNFDERAAAVGIDIDLLAARIRRRKSEAFQIGYDALLEWAQEATFADLLSERGDVLGDGYGEPFDNPLHERGVQVAERLCQERQVAYDYDLVYPGWRDAVHDLWARLDEEAEKPSTAEAQVTFDDIPF